MTRTRLGILGLCAVVFGLMALNAVGAQAEIGAKWLILNAAKEVKEVGTETLTEVPIEFEKDSPAMVLHSEILKIKVLFLCTELKAVNAKQLANGSIGKAAGQVNGSQILFSGCSTDLNGSLAPECTPTDPVDGKGAIITKLGHALLILGASGEDLLEVAPDAGKTFLAWSMPAGCPIGTSVPIIGVLRFKDCENLALTHLVKHLIEEGPGTKLFTISETPEHAATLLGSAWGVLGGAHAGRAYSAAPA